MGTWVHGPRYAEMLRFLHQKQREMTPSGGLVLCCSIASQGGKAVGQPSNQVDWRIHRMISCIKASQGVGMRMSLRKSMLETSHCNSIRQTLVNRLHSRLTAQEWKLSCHQLSIHYRM